LLLTVQSVKSPIDHGTAPSESTTTIAGYRP